MSRRILPPTDAYPHSPPPPLKYTPWSSEFPAENLSKLALTRIKFYYDTQPNYNGKVRLSRIMVYICIYNETTAHGTDLTRHTSTTKHKEHIVVLDRDEWIIKVDGWQYSSVLMNITLFTNKQRVHRPCGESTLLMVDGEPARPFSIESGDKGLGLLWLSGL
ncbi:hypothetical protein DFH27DRAFT_280234 [Peziza echinospora]|nr:hypothetical protein DFH27DRAFT_280234 [Peziza echinospora]